MTQANDARQVHATSLTSARERFHSNLHVQAQLELTHL
jgi:hypothetical protein